MTMDAKRSQKKGKLTGELANEIRRSHHPHPNTHHKQDSLEAELKTTNDAKEAASLIRQAPVLLKQVQESYLLKHHRRSYPTFHKSEVDVGPLLGVGGFGVVFEVENLILRAESSDEKKHSLPAEELAFEQRTHHRNSSEVSFNIPDDNPDDIAESKKSLDKEESHYDVSNARSHMVKFVRRDGEARYAIKRLHKDLPELARARGQIDLAIEATLLSGLWHPNIIKMRAVAEGDFLQRHFFIIMDRLYDTLDVRIKQWKNRHNQAKGNFFGLGADKSQLYQLTVERLTVAYDLAAALAYMHANHLIYRDLKQQNIGFDVRGDVKIFDFGLSKAINEDLKAKDDRGNPVYGYNLTPRTGSIPYMAPEVVERKPYDEMSDVFSFAVLFWEILALKQAFRGYDRLDYLTRVVRQKERPSIGRKWPLCAPLVIKEAWNDNPQKRPTMKRVATLIRGDLNEMSHDEAVTHRSMHMQNRSAHSAHLRILLEKGEENQDQ